MLADYLRTARLGEARLAMFCRRHSYRGGRPPAELLQRLRDAAVAPVRLDPNVLTELVRAQTILIESALTTIARLDAAIGALLPSHPKTELLALLPRIGEINLAQVIAEIGPLLDRCDNPDQAAAAAVSRPSPASPARAATSSSASPATPEHVSRSPVSPTTPGTALPGPATSTPPPANEASDTHTPYASSPAPGSASSGPAGTPTPPATPHATPPKLDTPPDLTQGTQTTPHPRSPPRHQHRPRPRSDPRTSTRPGCLTSKEASAATCWSAVAAPAPSEPWSSTRRDSCSWTTAATPRSSKLRGPTSMVEG